MRGLDDARRARVRFTSECLAFANLPCDETIEALLRDGEAPPNHPRWKSRVARDRGTSWDFDDVRDHYVKRIFDVDPRALAYADRARYLELGRVAVGEAMAGAMSEWRRVGSECAGALVWFLRDLWDGAGWGLVDARGVPKSPYYYLKRVLPPVALLAIDEGLNGLALHAINDSARAIDAEVRVALYRGENVVAEGTRGVTLDPHDAIELSADAVVGRFTDVTYAYRFGPPGHDVTVARLSDAKTGATLGRAFHFPRGLRDERASDLGIEARAERIDENAWRLTVGAKKTAWAVAVDARGFVADDDFFHVAPGDTCSTVLTGRGATIAGSVKPLNASAPTKIVCAR
jgi:beta-mannosidase